MLEFLMYKLEEILPQDKFNHIISQFSINKAQEWLDDVRGLIGFVCYDSIKEEFKARQKEEERKANSEMNCTVRDKGCRIRNILFQVNIGAEKHPELSGKEVDRLFTNLFAGV